MEGGLHVAEYEGLVGGFSRANKNKLSPHTVQAVHWIH